MGCRFWRLFCRRAVVTVFWDGNEGMTGVSWTEVNGYVGLKVRNGNRKEVSGGKRDTASRFLCPYLSLIQPPWAKKKDFIILARRLKK